MTEIIFMSSLYQFDEVQPAWWQSYFHYFIISLNIYENYKI